MEEKKMTYSVKKCKKKQSKFNHIFLKTSSKNVKSVFLLAYSRETITVKRIKQYIHCS